MVRDTCPEGMSGEVAGRSDVTFRWKLADDPHDLGLRASRVAEGVRGLCIELNRVPFVYEIPFFSHGDLERTLHDDDRLLARHPNDRVDETAFYDPLNWTFPSGCHICEVEIDPTSGIVRLERVIAVDDVGEVSTPWWCMARSMAASRRAWGRH